jgi:hypothetical protein
MNKQANMSTSEYSYEFTKYAVDICADGGEEVKKMIEKYGVAIIHRVLNQGECDMMVSGIWDYFEHIYLRVGSTYTP